MAKKSSDTAIREGLERLMQTGVAVTDASADGVNRLVAEFGKSRDGDLAIVYSLGRMATENAVAALTGLLPRTEDKALKKELKRAVFKLRQRGLTIEEEAAEEPPPARLAAPPAAEAYMSAVDGGGGRLIWIAKPRPQHGLQVMQAMLHDREGLLRVGGAQIPRKELRKMAADIKRQHEVTMIEIPWEYADHEIYRGYERARERGRTGLESFHEIRSVFAAGKPKEVPHPIYAKLDAASARDGAWRESSRRLLEEEELRYWVIAEDWLTRFIAQLQEAQTSRLVLNPVQKEERFAAIVRDAVKALCSDENGRCYQRRMEDMALYFLETGRPEPSRLAFAVALQIAEGDPGPLDISFLTGLVQKSFAYLLSQEKQKKEDEPSLIIKP